MVVILAAAISMAAVPPGNFERHYNSLEVLALQNGTITSPRLNTNSPQALSAAQLLFIAPL
jgi:hypothetical protein